MGIEVTKHFRSIFLMQFICYKKEGNYDPRVFSF